MTTNDKKDVDLFRDTPVRYLGYANELGESFRAQIGSKWVMITYVVATLYCLADTTDKSLAAYKKSDVNTRVKKTLYTAGDTLLWQLLASVIIPGFTINRICAGSNYLLKYQKKLPKQARTWIVTTTGLAAIPFIIKPIDHFVDRMLDESLRKFAP